MRARALTCLACSSEISSLAPLSWFNSINQFKILGLPAQSLEREKRAYDCMSSVRRGWSWSLARSLSLRASMKVMKFCTGRSERAVSASF